MLTTGAEVDFVVSVGNQMVPFKITYASQIERKKLNNLMGFMSSSPEVRNLDIGKSASPKNTFFLYDENLSH